MRTLTLLAAMLLAATTAIAPATAQSTSTRAKQMQSPGTQIACTRVGCKPIPRGCHIEAERSPDGTPTGYDAVICP